MFVHSRGVAALLTALLPLLTVGCGGGPEGPERFHVSGVVTFDGKPLPAGVVTFSPDASKGNSGPQGVARIKDGNYNTNSQGGKGVTGGPQVVKIMGSDGKVFVDDVGDEHPDGRPLFLPWEMQADLGREEASFNFDVPAEAAQRNRR